MHCQTFSQNPHTGEKSHHHEKNAIFGWLETSGRSGVAKVSVFDTEVLENLCTHRNLPDTGLMILWYYSRSVGSRTGN